MFKISGIIVTYNGINWIERSIRSLVSSSIPIDIIIIDNGSTDGTIEKIKSDYPELELIISEKNLGFGKANNIGIKKAVSSGSDYVFLLNQDAWVEQFTLENMLNITRKDSNYGILSPIHLNGKGNAIDTKFQDYLNRFNTPNFYSDLYLQELKEVYNTNFINAAAWLISTECIRTVGLFDPIFNHYGEDDDFCRRVIGNGFKIGVVPNVKIYHDRPQGGEMRSGYDRNKIYNNALLEMRKRPYKRHFIIRKLMVLYIEFFFVFFGKNERVKEEIEKLRYKLSFSKGDLAYNKEK